MPYSGNPSEEDAFECQGGTSLQTFPKPSTFSQILKIYKLTFTGVYDQQARVFVKKRERESEDRKDEDREKMKDLKDS